VRNPFSVRRSVVGVLAASALVALGGCGSSGKPRPDLLFVSTRSGVYDIYEMNADGGLQRRVTSGGHGNASTLKGLFYETDPAWSPDGKSIAFSSQRSGSGDIFVMDVSGRNVRQLTSSAPNDSQPSFSPDGTEIAFQRGLHLWVMKADGTGAHRVTHDSAPERSPAWSPNGRWIAYSRDDAGTPVREVWLVHPDGSGRHQLTSIAASANTPAWSPDGRQLVFSDDARGGGFKLWTIGVGGIGIRRLATSTQAFEPAWSPDGKTIAFSTSEGLIVTIPVGGTTETTLTKGKENDSSPAWNPVQAKAKTKGSGY
jgi:TolB protein